MIELIEDEQENHIKDKKEKPKMKSNTISLKINENNKYQNVNDKSPTSDKLLSTEFYCFDDNNKLKRRVLHSLFPFCFKVNSRNLRKIRINTTHESDLNSMLLTNKIKNQKYSMFTIIPAILLSQFSLFANQFYLILIISQFFDLFKVGLLIGYLAPLIFVLVVTFLKEGYDDYLRFKQDKLINNQKYIKIVKNINEKGTIIEKLVKSKNIKIGDIIKVKLNERVPADMIILYTSNDSDQIFIRTDQLDGETDWKLRKPIKLVEKYFEKVDHFVNYLGDKEDLDVIVCPPSKQIYEFQGSIIYNSKDNKQPSQIGENIIKESVGLENTMWSNTVLASNEAIGLVINIGKETRALMNSNEKINKIGKLDLEVNFLSKVLFIIMILISILTVLLKERGINNFYLSCITCFRFIVLFCSIIPIALRVNLDISKTVFSMNISNDNQYIPGAIARNSTIPEDLGRIEYLFSDKTGTLTKNEMVFKSLALESEVFGNDTKKEIRKILVDDFKVIDTPFYDLITGENSNNIEGCFNSGKKLRRNKKKILRDTVTAMALCNSVNVVLEEKVKNKQYSSNLVHEICKNDVSRFDSCRSPEKRNDHSKEEVVNNRKNNTNYNSYKEESLNSSIITENNLIEEADLPNYQASSPDEIALVKMAGKLGCQLSYRDENIIKIKNIIIDHKNKVINESVLDMSISQDDHKRKSSNNLITLNDYEEEYEILHSFPFSSDSKRMGIILRNTKYKYIVFYLKGAESIVEKFIKEDSVGIMKEHCENLATSGLRTLVFSFKLLSNNFYKQWAIKYNEALNVFENRKERISKCMEELECNLEFLAVSGVEDLLQDEVTETIESLRNAGIKIWMLTGDKVETATCISISTGIKAKNQVIKYITDDTSISRIKQILDIYSSASIGTNKNNDLLIIDGQCLEVVLNNFEEQFFKIALKSASVICCRCSPTQKAQIVSLAKKYTNKRLCAVGDGGNDVSMIQEAHVGIGLVGKEGMQASLASDYSILTFKHLNYLLLWHGRISYKNTAKIAKFIMHRGMIISFIQVSYYLF